MPSCRAQRTSSQSIPNSTYAGVSFDAEVWDNDAIHDPATNPTRLTAKTAGIYSIVGHAEWAANGTGKRLLSIWLNGGTIISMVQDYPATGTEGPVMQIATQYTLSVNDFIELALYQTSGGALNIVTGNILPALMMTRISGL